MKLPSRLRTLSAVLALGAPLARDARIDYRDIPHDGDADGPAPAPTRLTLTIEGVLPAEVDTYLAVLTGELPYAAHAGAVAESAQTAQLRRAAEASDAEVTRIREELAAAKQEAAELSAAVDRAVAELALDSETITGLTDDLRATRMTVEARGEECLRLTAEVQAMKDASSAGPSADVSQVERDRDAYKAQAEHAATEAERAAEARVSRESELGAKLEALAAKLTAAQSALGLKSAETINAENALANERAEFNANLQRAADDTLAAAMRAEAAQREASALAARVQALEAEAAARETSTAHHPAAVAVVLDAAAAQVASLTSAMQDAGVRAEAAVQAANEEVTELRTVLSEIRVALGNPTDPDQLLGDVVRRTINGEAVAPLLSPAEVSALAAGAPQHMTPAAHVDETPVAIDRVTTGAALPPEADPFTAAESAPAPASHLVGVPPGGPDLGEPLVAATPTARTPRTPKPSAAPVAPVTAAAAASPAPAPAAPPVPVEAPASGVPDPLVREAEGAKFLKDVVKMLLDHDRTWGLPELLAWARAHRDEVAILRRIPEHLVEDRVKTTAGFYLPAAPGA